MIATYYIRRDSRGTNITQQKIRSKERSTPKTNSRVVPTIVPVSPSDSMSMILMATETKTIGRTIHLMARRNRTPIKPIHCSAIDLESSSSGVEGTHCARPMPRHTPMKAPPRTKEVGYLSNTAKSLAHPLGLALASDREAYSSSSTGLVTAEDVRTECRNVEDVRPLATRTLAMTLLGGSIMVTKVNNYYNLISVTSARVYDIDVDPRSVFEEWRVACVMSRGERDVMAAGLTFAKNCRNKGN